MNKKQLYKFQHDCLHRWKLGTTSKLEGTADVPVRVCSECNVSAVATTLDTRYGTTQIVWVETILLTNQ